MCTESNNEIAKEKETQPSELYADNNSENLLFNPTLSRCSIGLHLLHMSKYSIGPLMDAFCSSPNALNPRVYPPTRSQTYTHFVILQRLISCVMKNSQFNWWARLGAVFLFAHLVLEQQRFSFFQSFLIRKRELVRSAIQ